MRHIEDRIQEACVTWFDMQYPKLSRLLHHSPNGGKRNAREGARFKAMGTRAGFADLIFLFPANGYHGLFIEMKTKQKTSRQSKTQKEFQEIVEKQGYKYVICRAFDEFRHTILSYMKQDSSIENQ